MTKENQDVSDRLQAEETGKSCWTEADEYIWVLNVLDYILVAGRLYLLDSAAAIITTRVLFTSYKLPQELDWSRQLQLHLGAKLRVAKSPMPRLWIDSARDLLQI